MRRQLNLKATGWLLGVLIVGGAGLASLHSFQVVRHAAVLLRQADKALKENRPEFALRYYRLYLGFQPNDVDAAERYGLALEKYADGPADREKAAQVLDGVLRRDPQRKEVRYRLILCLVNLFRFNEARAQAERLLPDWDKKGEMEHIIGWCFETDKDYDHAADWFRKAIAAEPTRIVSYVLLAGVLQQRPEERDQAAAVMEDMVKANPQSFQAFLTRRQFLLQAKGGVEPRPELAEMDLQKALALAPNEPAVVLAAAEAARKNGKMDEARKLLSRGLDAHRDSEGLYRALADLEVADGKPGAARSALERGVGKSPQSSELLVRLIDLLIDEGDLPASEQRLEELRNDPSASLIVEYFEARLLIERRHWAEAVLLLDRLRGELPTGSPWMVRVNVLLGWCYRQLGDADQQLMAFERAGKQDPNLFIARWGQGSALLTLGRLTEAQEFLELATGEASKGPKTTVVPPEAWHDLVRCLMRKNLRLPEGQRDWTKVKEALKQTLKSQKTTAETVVLQAEVEVAQKNFAAARKLLEKSRAEFPRSVTIECALADLAARQQELFGALNVLDDAEKRLGPSFELRLARLRFWGRQRSPLARKELTALGDNLQTLSDAERAQFLRDLADTWMKLGDSRSAEQCWRRLIQERPTDLRARLGLLELWLFTNNLDAARQTVADLRQLEGQRGVFWHYGAAALLLAESHTGASKLPRAREHLAACYRVRQDWSRLPLLEGQMDEAEGKFDSAIKNYTNAFNLGERTPGLVYRLLKMLQERRRFVDAERLLQTYEAQVALLPELAKLGVDLALASNNMDRVLGLAAQAVPRDSRDYRDYLWLAHVYRDDKEERGQSIGKLLDKAVSLAPYMPETWVAVVAHQARIGQAAKVPGILAELGKKVPAERLPITLARCHEIIGQFDQAQKHFEVACKLNPRDFVVQAASADFFRHSDQPNKAVPFLQKLLEPDSLAPLEIQSVARRHLAVILAGKGDVKQALEVLDAGPRLSPADSRIRYLVEAFDPARREKALKKFEDLRAGRAATPEELVVLTAVYAAGDQPDSARNTLAELVTVSPDNPQYLARYVRSLLQNNEPTAAATYFQMLERREPFSPRTNQLRSLIVSPKR